MADNTELAKAYIAIVPSMDGFTGKLSQLMNSEAESAGASAGSALGSGMLGTFGKVLSAAAVGKLLKESFLEGADLEQSIGGVETLFKDSADEIKAYAAEAYRTAGLSANEYMETATSFSASLIKSLDGDTRAAAERTQTAITDMSDNVNKFGGDVQSLQNAYQGFARDNFTMLDNLRLGYAGNKAGMESLLADAEALSGIHYDISSYADMIDAIHVIQQNLDITGTTAMEAAQTFSGSFGAMRASAKNLAGTLTTGGDVGKALEGLKESSSDFGNNVLRMLGNLQDGLGVTGDILLEGTAIAAGYAGALAMTSAIEGITGFIKKAKEANSLMSALDLNPLAVKGAAIAAIGMGIKIAVDNMTDAINEIPDAYAGLDESQRELVDSTSELVSEISSSAKARSDDLAAIEKQSESTGILIDEIYRLNAAEELDKGSKAQLSALVDELNERYPDLNLAMNEHTGHLNKMRAAVEELTRAEELRAKAQAANDQLSDMKVEYDSVKEKRDAAYKEYTDAKARKAAIEKAIAEAEKEINDIWAAGDPSSAMIARYDELQNEILPGLREELALQREAVGELAEPYRIASVAVRELEDEMETCTAALTEAEEQEQAIRDRMNMVQSVIDHMKDYVITTSESTYYISQDTYDKIQEISASYYGSVQAQEDSIRRSLDLFSEFNGGLQTSAEEMFSALESNKQGIEQWAQNLRTLAEWGIDDGLLDTLEKAGPSSASKVKALVDMGQPRLKEYSDLWIDTQETISKTAEEQMSDVKEAAGEAIAELIRQPGEAKPDIEEAWEVLGAAAPESFFKKFDETVARIAPVSGLMIQRALISGMDTEMIALQQHAEKVAETIVSTLKYSLDIHSPSKRVEDEVGQYILPGVVKAMEDTEYLLQDAAESATDSLLSGFNAGYSAADLGGSAGYRGEGSQPADRPLLVQIITPDKRELASLMIDDINELQAAQFDLAGRGYI